MKPPTLRIDSSRVVKTENDVLFGGAATPVGQVFAFHPAPLLDAAKAITSDGLNLHEFLLHMAIEGLWQMRTKHPALVGYIPDSETTPVIRPGVSGSPVVGTVSPSRSAPKQSETGDKSCRVFDTGYDGAVYLREGPAMLGWHISVYRQTDGGASPATRESPEGERLAVWQTGAGGLEWLDELLEKGNAIHLGGNGYPFRYTAKAQYLIPSIIDNPPQARRDWIYEASDILADQWAGTTVIDRTAAANCRPDEWLLVEAWDES